MRIHSHTQLCSSTRQLYVRGVTAIETVVGISLLSLVVLFSVQAITDSLAIGKQQVARTQAIFLTEEALEAVRFIRDDDWDSFALEPLETDLYLTIATTTGSISLSTTPASVQGFTTVLQLHEVCRDGANDITTGGCGAPETDARYMTATTTWAGGDVSLAQYLLNIHP